MSGVSKENYDCYHCYYLATIVSDIAIFVLKRDVKLQLTNLATKSACGKTHKHTEVLNHRVPVHRLPSSSSANLRVPRTNLF